MRFDFTQGNLVETIVRQRKSKSGWLDEIEQLVSWPDLVSLFDHVYASTKGGAPYPIETYIKLLLLQQWYGLSDESLEAAVDDRLSFRRFCGVPLDRPVQLDLVLSPASDHKGRGRAQSLASACWRRSTNSWTRGAWC